ncbi:glycosyltransferase family 117 protein [Panacibacter microcysteis]|uniref:glycosyltransferase family 117 protein n=1 Tax=Panacibacter microcysteis TaxID=2793269 RepID=UPI001E3E3AC5|nr:DUF2723 domain-containing protein [Panacibacter microcysteis]
MNFSPINNITGWVMCLFASTVYILTSEPGGSFWDCGEFVSSCFKVQIPHPPGAPLFVLLGRLFVILFGNDPMTAARAVNIMSAVASGFTILFLFWTITHFAVKIMHQNTTQPITRLQQWSVIAAGIVGALAGTFTDSFWYSAVEGEVYAMSSLFTAIVFWAALKWERNADEPGADKWLVFIFLMIGLSIGVHLLCLLCVPVIVVVYYLKRRETFNYPVLRKYFIRSVIAGTAVLFIGAIAGGQLQADAARGIPADKTMAVLLLAGGALCIAFLYVAEKISKQQKALYGGLYIFFMIGVAVFGFILKAVIQYSIKGAGAFDVFFVNDLGMPFFSGFAFFFLLVAAGLWWALGFAAKKNLVHVRLFLWCIAFTFVGYSTYITTLIRSNADTSIDMFNVDNPQALEGYLGREQYGDFPLVYGQTFNAQPVDYAYGKMKYSKGGTKYLPAGRSVDYVFMPSDKMIFPRMWDMSNDQGHADYYAFFAGIGKSGDGTYERSPTFMENVSFFLSYQTYFMYIRYFFWNFSGRQNDIQGMFIGNVRDGNWISGIPIIDNVLYGDQSAMPESIAQSKGHNVMFMLPFILGIIGLLYHVKKNSNNALINVLLFLSTGLAVVIYINQPGYQPRERDYAYTGSFYAFAVWIGLAVLYFIEMAVAWNSKLLKDIIVNTSFVAGLLTVFILIAGYGGAAGITTGVIVFLLIAFTAFAVPFVLKLLKQPKLIVTTAFAASLLVPLLMAACEWDDHDRSKKQLARDVARDMLESCAPNTILFTAADNDTYPLWYAQEVEGVRPDVRIVIMTLLGTDWLINSLRHKVNNSDPIDVIWSPAQTQGNKRDYIFYQPQPQFPDNRYYDLYDMMKNWVGSEDPAKMVSRGDGDLYNTYPVKKLSVPVDEKTVRTNGTANEQDSVLKEMRFEIPPKNVLLKSDLAILNIIAANKWQRPIYFTMPFNDLGFQQYLRKDGMAYRLVPVNNPEINTAKTYDLIMDPKRWGYGNANLPGVYLDEINRSQLLNVRKADLELAYDLIFKDRLADAKKVLEHDDKMINTGNLPYGMASRNNNHNSTSIGFLEACYRAGATALAAKIHTAVKKDLEQQQVYYNALDEVKRDNLRFDINTTNNLLEILNKLDQQYNHTNGKALQ